MGKDYRSVVVYLLLFTLISIAVFADPNSPTSITQGQNSRRSDGGAGFAVAAQAGNVTELAINGIATTQAWQGYYGNISGQIVLDNANNQSFYKWDLATPQGEIYAANNSVVANWVNVTCVNLTGNGTTQGLNASQLNAIFGISEGDSDSFQETFNETYTGDLFIGTNNVTEDRPCPMTQLFNGSGASSSNWKEVLLSDQNQTRVVIFASILGNNVNAFDNSSRDFQMLVAENGHNGDTSPTTWYFFVELE